MAEYIDRKKAIEIIEQHMTKVVRCANVGSTASEVYSMAKDHAIDYLRYVPTEDVVPVVRCKDCKYSTERQGFENRMWNDDCVMCDHIAPSNRIPMNKNDYCSYGERKNDNG